MTNDDFTGDDTLGLSTAKAASSIDDLKHARVPILTLLSHPDPSRVGERSWLNDPGGEGGVRLSRLHPAFGKPGEPDHAPLRDKYLSRQPHTLALHNNGSVTLSPRAGAAALRVNGRPRDEPLTIAAAELEAGVVLTLGERVVLLLHTASPAPGEAASGATLIGGSPQLAAVRERIGRVARHDVPVLIRGESGTGKELVARAIHDASPRAGKAFVSVNMAALVPSTAAAALFGHTRGAFTGATQPSEGFFGAADGGTLFLDEIGDTPPEVQPALLRALENGEVQPLGADHAVRRDVRLITATDADLERAVDAGRFRLPLLQRLAGYSIDLPPLRARKQDIAELLVHFLRQSMAERGLDRLEPDRRPWLPAILVEQAVLAPWPGNVRQLRNFATQLLIDYGDAPRIELDKGLALLPTAAALPEPHDAPSPAPAERRLLRDISEDAVIAALARHDYKPGPAAKALGISRPSMYALIESSPRIRKAGDLGAEEIQHEIARASGDLAAAARALEVSLRGLQLRMRQLGLHH